MSSFRLTTWNHFVSVLTLLLIGSPALAADFTWNGVYRVEGLRIENPELGSRRQDKAYIQHHLVLQPKIVAADGLTVYSRFDLFNNCAFGQGNQMGQFFGNGPGTSAYGCDPGTTGAANTTTEAGDPETLAVNLLYATWVHEYGVLVVGRAPKQFGLGITHNAGSGLFDHYFDNEDMVGYKFIVGNLSLMPMIGKTNEGNLGVEDDVNDYMIHLQYENPETDLELGIFYQSRVATFSGNDAPRVHGANPAAAAVGDYTAQFLNVYTRQKFDDFSVGVEAGFNSGKTGVDAAGNEISLSGFGIAGEFAYAPEDSRWSFGLKTGMATGDDPGTADNFEGFVFDRNYDVAFLMFNHVLGAGDPFRTSDFLNNRAIPGTNTATSASEQADTEAISNAVYIAPYWQQKMGEEWAWGGTVATGFLNIDPYSGANTKKDLGYELDLNVTYKPYERFVLQAGGAVLFPGAAFEGGSNNFDSKWAYGLWTKAAVNF